MSSSSPAGRPINWTPIGSPSGDWTSGSDTAGWPVTFHTGVNGTNPAEFSSICSAGSPSAGWSAPIGIGGWASVGISITSIPSHSDTICRDNGYTTSFGCFVYPGDDSGCMCA